MLLVDPLTGLTTHSAFHERLRAALQLGSRLSLALLDVDRFKAVNDAAGHVAGDHVLAAVARRLRGVTGPGDILARVGGDEFALLLPGRGTSESFAVVEAARASIAATPLIEGRTITVSAGICDLDSACDPDTLVRLAGCALQWAKGRGRDATCIYDPAIVHRLAPFPDAGELDRSHAMLGLRALARAIDARDRSTRRHSDRVATLARRLALMLEWTPERTALLEDAALVHDIGKVGVPDSILFKPGRLDPEEYEQVKQHAVLGAEITGDILGAEQVAWIRAHHERPDGRGYPDGLRGEQIPDGAAILAVADAFDVMTTPRPYGSPKQLPQVLSECAALVGRQFALEPVRALTAAIEQGGVPWVASISRAAAGSGAPG